MIAFTLVMTGWSRVTQRLVLEPDGIALVGVFYRRWVPWAALHGVRLTAQRQLALAWAPDETFETAPLAQAREAAALIATLREQTTGLTAAEPSKSEPSKTFRPGALAWPVTLLLVFVAGSALALQL
jgi:hypothetical protein